MPLADPQTALDEKARAAPGEGQPPADERPPRPSLDRRAAAADLPEQRAAAVG